MAFLGGLFDRKPGGTFLGNLFRGVVKTAAGAIPVVGSSISQAVGNGAGMITQDQYDIKHLSDSDYVAKYGVTKTGVLVPGISPNASIMTVDQRFNDLGLQSAAAVNGTSTAAAIGTAFKKYWWVLLVIPAVIWGIIKLVKSKKRR